MWSPLHSKSPAYFFAGSLPQLRYAYSLFYRPTLLLETALNFLCTSAYIVTLKSSKYLNPRKIFLSLPSVHKHQSYCFRFSSFVTVKTEAGLKLGHNNQQNVPNTFTSFLHPKTFKTTLKSQQIWYQYEAPFLGYYLTYTKHFLFHQISSQAFKTKCPGSTQFLPIQLWGFNAAETKNIGVVPKPTKNPQCENS